jgi:hypothetical protein
VTSVITSGTDWIGVIEYWNENLFAKPSDKNGNMEFPKAMLAEMNAKMGATQERMDANTKAMPERMEAKMKETLERQMHS